MKNWILLRDVDNDNLWNVIYNKYKFQPHEQTEIIFLPNPNLTFNISDFYNDGYVDDIYDELHSVAIKWFIDIFDKERLYAVSWQHEGYSFLPNLPFEYDEFGEWLIPVFPNGDFNFFLSKDLKNGIFADGINFSISFFGEDLLKSIIINRPKILGNR